MTVILFALTQLFRGSMFVPLLRRMYEMVDYTVLIGEIVRVLEWTNQDVVSRLLTMEQQVIATNNKYLAY